MAYGHKTAPFTGAGDATVQVYGDVLGSGEMAQGMKIVDGTAAGTTPMIVTGAGAAKVDPSGVTSPMSAADGGLVTVGTTTDASSATTLVGLLKAIKAAVQGTLTVGTHGVTVADGGDTAQGTTSDASSANTVIGLLKAIKAAVVGTLTVSGTVTANAGTGTMSVEQVPGTTGGYTIGRIMAAASTNATSLKGSAGKVFGYELRNTAAYDVSLKLYNKATAPTVGTDTPVWTIDVPAGAMANVEYEGGIAFATGIAYAITKLVADSDATVVVANDLVGGLFYK